MSTKTKRLSLWPLIIILFIFSSCTVYRSADRQKFEADAPTLKIKTIQKKSCSLESVAELATVSRLLTIIDDEFIWEHRQDNSSTIYESTNLNGLYCLYEVEFE